MLNVAAETFLLMAIAVVLAPVFSTHHAVAKEEWTSQHYQDHPLAGTIWTSDLEAVTESQLETTLSEASFVLLGEIHNNPDHHRLQAQIITALVKNGRRPAIVFEMIPVSLQADLDRYVKSGPPDASALGSVLRWKQRGWPDWAIYRPIAEAALSGGLPMLAGALDRETLKDLASAKPSQANAKMIEELDLARPVKPEISKAQGQEINDGHCNMLPATAIEPMIKAQRARDAYLAKAMLSGQDGNGAVLIAGSGHVRKDWAVPHIIHQKLPGAKVAVIAFLEVDPERTSPSDYMRDVPGLEEQFDFIYMTPRADLTNHCAEFRKHMEKKKSGKASER